MKIRKTFVGNLPDNKIVNSNSTSETDTYSCKYLNERNVIVSSEEPTTGEEVWIKKGKNLINPTELIYGCELGENGTLIKNSNWVVTPYITVTENQKYYVYGFKNASQVDVYHKCYYDENYEYIGDDSLSLFTTPKNTRYVRLNGRKEYLSALILVQSDVAISYEPYITKKIHTKNNNGVYEEFYNEENYRKYEAIYEGSILVGGTMKLNNAKRFLDIYYSIYPNSSGCLTGKYTIDTNKADVTYGSTVALAHDSTNGLEYYVDESSFDLNTKILTHTRSGYFNVSSGIYTGRDTSSYTVYRIETYD